MFLKVLSVSIVAIAILSFGKRRKQRNKKLPSKSSQQPKCTCVKQPTMVKKEKPPATLTHTTLHTAALVLLVLSVLLGGIMFLDSLHIQEDFLQASVIGTFMLIAIFIIFNHDTSSKQTPKTSQLHISDIHVDMNLSGTWIKAAAESTSQEAMFQLMKISPLLRTAVRLMKGLSIEQTQDKFRFTVLSVFSFIKVTEIYSMNGDCSEWNRRDLRRGRHTGYVDYQRKANSFKLHLQWGAPFSGRGIDEFILLSKSKLLVRSTAESGGNTAAYDTIYYKES